MDMSRSVKRLIVIVVLAIGVILLSKSLLSKAVKNLSVAAEKKQQAKSDQSAKRLPESAAAIVLPGSSAVADTAGSGILSAPLPGESSSANQ
jgi:hypothetical protein